MSEGKESAQLEVANKLKKSSNYILLGAGIAVLAVSISYSVYFGLYVDLKRSENPEAWVHFSSIFSNFLSPTIAVVVLWFVVRSYYLQKTEFEGMRDNLATQLEIDSNLRRQASIVQEARNICSMIEKKWVEEASYTSSDYKNFSIFKFSKPSIFPQSEVKITVKLLAEHIGSLTEAGHFNNQTPELPGDLNYVLNLLKVHDSILERIAVIDDKLGKISSTLNDGYHRAVIFAINPRVRDIADVYRKIGYFKTVNKDVLRHF